MPFIDATYDATIDAAYLSLSDPQNAGPLDQLEIKNTPLGVMMILDFDSDGYLVGLEIVGAAQCLPQDLLASYRQIDGPGTPLPEWVSSARMAAWPVRLWWRLWRTVQNGRRT